MIFRRPVSKIRNERFNLFASGISQVRGTAGVGGISFDEIGIEVMLTDQKTEAIAEARVSILMTIVVCC